MNSAVAKLIENPAAAENHYFDSYANTFIHEEMIKDKVRTNGYKKAIENARHLFRDKIVLDVGCGTGILSIFAARAGAAKVYAVEASGMSKVTAEIIADNNLSDTITVMHGKIEEVTLPESVDIIISEWMGYSLLYESMIESVIFARDRWLKPGGFMFPDKIDIQVTLLDDKGWLAERCAWWDNVYGIDMSAVGRAKRDEPLNDIVKPADLLTLRPTIIRTIDMQTTNTAELYNVMKFAVICERGGKLDGIVLSFNTLFTHGRSQVAFGTDSFSPPTHWKQMIYYMRPRNVKKGTEVSGEIRMCPNKVNRRNIDVYLKCGNFEKTYIIC